MKTTLSSTHCAPANPLYRRLSHLLSLVLLLLANTMMAQVLTPKATPSPAPSPMPGSEMGNGIPITMKPISEKTWLPEKPALSLLDDPWLQFYLQKHLIPAFPEYHEFQMEGFISRPGNGVRRTAPPAAYGLFTQDSNTWQVKEMELVSIIMHDPAVAYVDTSRFLRFINFFHQESSLSMQKLGEYKLRPLTKEEQQALLELKAGKETATLSHGMMGAIRARESCLKCHEVDKGDLLGAFTYFVELFPSVPDKAAP